MNPTLWHRLTIAGAAIAFIHVIGAFAAGFVTGDPGFTAKGAALGDYSRYRIIAVQHPEQARPALHAGDVIQLENHSLLERMRYYNSRSGDRFAFVRADGRRVEVRLAYMPPNALDYVFALVRLSMISIAVLLAIRRPDGVETRALAAFLLLFAFALAPSPEPFFPDGMAIGFIFAREGVMLAALAQAVRLATVFPDPECGGLRRRIRRLNRYITAAYAIGAAYALTQIYIFESTPPRWCLLALNTSIAYYISAIAFAFTIANRRSTGAERARVAWVSYSLAVGFSGAVIETALVLLGRTEWWINLFALTLLAIPLGLSYAIARHRVIDIGFVVNRAIVFATLSAVVVVSFGVLEWFLGKYLVELSHATSASLEIGLALILGASLRQIHRRVEKVADDIFFRDRHRAEAALKRFALDAQYTTYLRTIFERTIDEVSRHAGARECALYLIDGKHLTRSAGSASFPENVDENDPLFVRMRATRDTVEMHGIASALEAELAFPFIVRGTISGALICGAKRNGEAYAPDERAVLADVARSVGIASDTLYTEALRLEIERVMGARPSLGAARDLLARSATGGAESAF
ncbi:MAG: hypothetical protein NVSMB64_31680 [Candidatus Velthaea sp.]